MKTKTAGLTGPALDLAVSRADNAPGRDGWGWFERDAEGYLFDPLNECRYSPSTDWSQGGPIIEREKISVVLDCGGDWIATKEAVDYEGQEEYPYGPTPLVAAMRCFVASKLGDTVDVPDELC